MPRREVFLLHVEAHGDYRPLSLICPNHSQKSSPISRNSHTLHRLDVSESFNALESPLARFGFSGAIRVGENGERGTSHSSGRKVDWQLGGRMRIHLGGICFHLGGICFHLGV